MKLRGLIWFIALPIGGLSAQVSVFEAGLGRPGSVVAVGAPVERPPELQEIVLLPIECVGRTRLSELDEGACRRRSDVPGASRLVLPAERGSLYRYRRDAPGSPSAFGYFLVPPEGAARSVFELSGSGSSGSDDPLPGRLSVAADGLSALVATSEDAGGDLWEIDLAGGGAVNRTSGVGPQEFERNGLALLGAWGFALCEDGALRFERAAGAKAGFVTLPIAARWHGPDVVASADGSTVAFLMGDDVNRALVFTCRRTGAALQASTQPMRIPGACFLPEDSRGPTLALSTDGSWVAWREDESSREAFVHETRSASAASDLHLTGPATFDNTLNDTGVIAFFDPNSAVMVVGRQESGGIGRGDLFRIDLTAGSSSFSASNLSGTSGIHRPPYDYGELDQAEGLWHVPGTGSYLAFSEDGGGELLRVGADGSTERLLDRVRSLDLLELSGAYLVAGVTRPPGVDNPQSESLNLVQVPRLATGASVVRLPDGCHLGRTVGSRTRDVFGGVLEFPAGEWLGRIQVPAPGLSASSSFLTFGPATGLAADGAVVGSLEIPSATVTFGWSDLGTRVLRGSAGGAFLLPGL